MNAFLARVNAWVTSMASTNWKIAVGMFMSVCTMIFYFGSEIRCRWQAGCRPIDSTNWGLWLTFVAAWAGISYIQYAKKRETYASPSPDSERANVPSDPAPASPTPDPDK